MAESRPIKILHIASGDLWAGAEVQLFTLATSLNKHSPAEVSVILLNHGTLEHRLLENGIKVSVLDERQLNALQILAKLVACIRQVKPDVIHTHRIKENILGSIAALVCGNIPTLRTAHGAPEHHPAWYRISKRLILSADWFCARFLQKKIVAVSQDLANILQQSLPAEKIAVIENGIDIESLTDASAATGRDGPEMHRQFSDNRPFKVGIAGRLVAIKRVDLFIQTAHQLASSHPEMAFSFHIYGDGPLRDQLQQLNHSLKTEKQVHFEGHCDNIPQQLQTLDALLMTSDHEGLPMILLEAMALKVAVIAHAVGGIPNLLAQGECGLLVQEHSARAYADAVYRLYIKPDERAEITKMAFSRVTQLYSAEINSGLYLTEYSRLLKIK